MNSFLVVIGLALSPHAISCTFGDGAVNVIAPTQKDKEDDAITRLTEAIKKNPANPETHYLRGVEYMSGGDVKSAIADFSEAIRLKPKFVKALAERGTAFFINGDTEKSLLDLNEAVKLDPKNAETYSARGFVYGETSQYAKAIADYTEAIQLDPQDTSAFICVARLHAACPDNKIRDGKKALSQAKEACKQTKSQDRLSLEVLAASYAELGMFDEAIKWETKAIEVIPKEFESIRKRAQTRLKQYEDGKPLRYTHARDW